MSSKGGTAALIKRPDLQGATSLSRASALNTSSSRVPTRWTRQAAWRRRDVSSKATLPSLAREPNCGSSAELVFLTLPVTYDI